MRLSSLHERWTTLTATPRGKRTVKLIRAVFLAAILGFLAYQLSGIGWGDLLTSMPRQPLFYVILVVMYLLLPTSEAIIYGHLWGIGFAKSLLALFRKRVLNADVLGYSGEVYLYVWARDRVAQSRAEIMATIKDNLIVSSVASITAAILLLTSLLATGQVALGDFMDNPSPLYVAGGLFVAGLAGALVLRFRRVIFSLSRGTLALLGTVHLSRFLLGYVLQVLQWWVVFPEASFQTWALLLTVLVVINRIPLMPSRDLIFISAGAGLSPLLDVPVAPVVSMLLVRSAVDRLLNAGAFGLSALLEPPPPGPDDEPGNDERPRRTTAEERREADEERHSPALKT